MPNKGKSGNGPGGRTVALPREIDENLKRVYRERLEEGVPDRFLALLDALRAKEAGSPTSAGLPGDDAADPNRRSDGGGT